MNRLFRPEDDLVGSIHDQLAHLAKIKNELPPALGRVEPLTQEQISVLVETAFWTSLRSNEGRTTRVSLAVAAPENFRDSIAFGEPVAEESQIVKLAPAVPPGGCLLVSASEHGLSIWGFGRRQPGPWIDTVTMDVSEPGTVRVGVGLFQPFAVLDGRLNPIIQGARTNLPHYLQRALHKVLPDDDFIETQAVWRECFALADIARIIVADGHGGTVLVVPKEEGLWSEAIRPFAYRFASPDTTIRDAVRSELSDESCRAEILQRLSLTTVPDDLKKQVAAALVQRPEVVWKGVRATASLAAVDGAVVITRDMRVLGFGAKIAAAGDSAPHVCMFRPEPGKQEVVPSPLENLGGTRHQSAAQFVATHRDAVALVISQDRHMSIMHWHDASGSVAVIRNAEWWA